MRHHIDTGGLSTITWSRSCESMVTCQFVMRKCYKGYFGIIVLRVVVLWERSWTRLHLCEKGKKGMGNHGFHEDAKAIGIAIRMFRE